jgi:hypothetical protein
MDDIASYVLVDRLDSDYARTNLPYFFINPPKLKFPIRL